MKRPTPTTSMGQEIVETETNTKRKKFTLREGYEIRGMMIRLYPDAETVESLSILEKDCRIAWNWLIADTENVLAARQAYAIKQRLVGPRPQRPVYDGMQPEEAGKAKAAYGNLCRDWHGDVYKATKSAPGCEFRKFKEVLAHFGDKFDYQMLSRVIGWRYPEDEIRKIKPGAHMLQALTKNYFQKSERRKKRRKSSDPMPLQVRSGSNCFEVGNFGQRRGKDFYDCQVKINGLTIRGRLPGKLPDGRILEGVSLTRLPDGWWASIKQEVPVRTVPAPEPGTVIGIDVGLDIMAAFSDRKKVPNARGKEFIERIAGRKALKLPTGRLEQKAARRAKHDIYTKVLPHVLAIETIKIEQLPKNIGQRGSVKISNMRMIAQMLLARYGAGRVREVDASYTSQDCSQCGHRSKETWSYAHGRYGYCPSCGYKEDRDVNAARNIAARSPI